MITISFIVTCYNEEKHVVGAIEKVHQAAMQLGLSHEILVFDDASHDATAQIVKDYIHKFPQVPVRLIQNIVNKGVAYNFIEGAFQGKGQYCRLICGDNVESIETHITILSRIGQADLIIPFYQKIEGRTLIRHFISYTFTRVVNMISGFNIRYYNGCPILKREDVMRWHVEATGLGYQAELIIRLLRQGKTYIEVPVNGFDREGSVSFRLRNILSVSHSLFKMSIARLRVSLLK